MIKYLICFFLLPSGLLAQPKYFEKSFNWYPTTTANQNGIKIFEDNNRQYVIGGLINSYNPSIWNTCTVIVDNTGTLIDTNEYHIDTTLFNGVNMYDMLPTEYGYIMVGFISFADSTMANVYVVRLSHDGILIDQHYYPCLYYVDDIFNYQSFINIGYSISRTPDNGYLIGGYAQSPIDVLYYPYLCKLNANLQLEWDTLYEQYANIESKIRLLKPAANGNGYYAVLNINTTYSEGDIAVLRIDDNGTILEEHIYGESTDKKELVSGFIETLDNEYAITFYQIPNTGPRYCGLLKTDQINGIEWANNTMYYNGGLDGGVIQLPDSSFIVSGGYVKQVEPYDVDIELNKFSNSGQWLWTRHYGNEGNDYIYDMIVDSQGSLVFCGRDEAVNLPDVINGANVYLLKTNCMGLLTQPQASFTATMDSAALTASFQNLSQFVYPDSIDGGHYIWDFGDGNTSTQANPTHTYAQGGNYTVTLTAVVCSDTSVFVQEVSTWAVGIDASPQPPPKEGEMQNLFSITPNPATNQAVAHLPPLLCANSGRLQLLSVTGKLLQSIPYAAKQQTVAFSVAHLPAGIYFVQVGNAVQKLVVE